VKFFAEGEIVKVKVNVKVTQKSFGFCSFFLKKNEPRKAAMAPKAHFNFNFNLDFLKC